MKITKERLRRIIKEEIEAVVDEGMFGKLGGMMGISQKGPEQKIQALKRLAKKGHEAVKDESLDTAGLANLRGEIRKAMEDVQIALKQGSTEVQKNEARSALTWANAVEKNLMMQGA